MVIATVEGKKRQAHYWPGGVKILASYLAFLHTTTVGDVEAPHYGSMRVEV